MIPQLAVAAFFTDPQFASRAAERIERHCPVKVPSHFDPIERHSATGPAGVQERSGKMLASLLSFCECLPALATREPQWRADEQNRALLKKDAAWDNSERIAKGWMATARDQFHQRGMALPSSAV